MRTLLGAVGTHGGLVGLFHNGAFVGAFLGFFFAQSAKVFTHYYTERKWDFTRLVSSGGMPSSHTGLVRGRAGWTGAARNQSEQLHAAGVALASSWVQGWGARLH